MQLSKKHIHLALQIQLILENWGQHLAELEAEGKRK